jgi:murein L,D-transpeptidase YcbB/YkuD
LRYLRDLHVGRLDPRAIGFRLQVPTDEHDYAGLVEAAIGSDQLGEVALGLRPQHPVYDSLRASLKRYRALAADLTLAVPPRPPGSLHAGQQYAGTPALSPAAGAWRSVPRPEPFGRAVDVRRPHRRRA